MRRMATRSGILDLVAAVVIPPSLLGGVTELRPQVVCPILQAAMDQFLRCGRYLLPDGGCSLRFLLDFIHLNTSLWKRPHHAARPIPMVPSVSEGLVVISLYSRFFGKLSIKGTMALPHLMRPRPESTLVM